MKCSVNACRLCPTVRTHVSVPSSVAWSDVTCDPDHASAHCVQVDSCDCVDVCAQLGDGSNTNRNTPPSSNVLTGVAAITATNVHTCALTTAGGVRCWGYNGYGQARHHLHTRVGVCVCVHVVWRVPSKHEESCTVHVCCFSCNVIELLCPIGGTRD